MIYALLITIAAGLALVALLSAAGWLVFRGGWRGLSIRGWRWQPSALGLTVLAVALAAVLWRFFPGFLFIPFIIPFFWRIGRRRRGPYIWSWRSGQRQQRPPTNGHSAGDRAIDAQYRPLDDE